MFTPRLYRILLACLLLALGAFVLAQTHIDEGPRYQGHTLLAWLRIYREAYTEESSATRKQAAESVRQIGTNAIPYLIRWTGSRESTAITGKSDLYTRDLDLAGHAFQGIEILGPDAKATVPILEYFINDTNIYSAEYTTGKHKAAWARQALASVTASKTMQ